LEDKDLNIKSYGPLKDAITDDITWNSAQPAPSKEINTLKVNPTPPLLLLEKEANHRERLND
jgi:hypothetical protein